jgi:hypothetical protein
VATASRATLRLSLRAGFLKKREKWRTRLLLWIHCFVPLFFKAGKFGFQFCDRRAPIRATSPSSTAPSSTIWISRTPWDLEIPKWKPNEAEIMGERILKSIRVTIPSVYNDRFVSWPKTLVLNFREWPRKSFFQREALGLGHFSIRELHSERIANWRFLRQSLSLKRGREIGYHASDITAVCKIDSQSLLRAIPLGCPDQSNDSTLSAYQLLPHHLGLLLDFSERVVGRIRSLMVCAVNLYRVPGIDRKENDAANFNKRLDSVPPILFLCASNMATGIGWWKLRMCQSRRDCWIGASGLIVGFPASVWGWIVFGDRIF